MAQNVKYQIFISSTYEDLKTERDQVIKAILEMGHIPVGMEMFSAADEEQWKIITRQIDASDYYVIIIAHRYGSVVDGLSYTEKEYDYAIKSGVPIIGFIIDQAAPWPADRLETETSKRDGLELFKEKVRKKPMGYWSTVEDLYGKFSIALMKLINTNPRPGWARATDLIGPEIMHELSRLSSENANLRAALETATTQIAFDVEEEFRKQEQSLNNLIIKISFRFSSEEEWSKSIETNMLTVFKVIAPNLIGECSSIDLTSELALEIGGKVSSAGWSVPSNYLQRWLADFAILDLIEPSLKKHGVKDTKEYWILTRRGQDFYKFIRKTDLEKRIQQAIENEKEENPKRSKGEK